MVSHCWECEKDLNCLSWAGGLLYFKRGSVVFSAKSFNTIILYLGGKLDFFLKKGIGYLLPYGLLNGARETGSHLRVRDDCHVLTFFESGRDIMCILIKQHGYLKVVLL